MISFYEIMAWTGFIAHWLLVAATTFRIIFKRRAVGVSVAWLLVIYILPLLGVLLYFMFGEYNLGKKRALRSQKMLTHYENWFRQLRACSKHTPQHLGFHVRPIHQLSMQRMGIPCLTSHDLELLHTSDAIFERILDDVNHAQKSINAEFYIWEPGGYADKIAKGLIKAKHRGVKVSLLLDAVGSRSFFNSQWPEVFKQSGIDVREALKVTPLRALLRRLDLRLHRKIFVIDNRIAYTGSMNMVDPAYFKQDSGVGLWIDVMTRIQGPASALLNCIQSWDWEIETGHRRFPNLPNCSIDSKHKHASHTLQIIPSGPGMPDDLIHQVLLLSIHHAQKSIIITTPYFVPSEQLLFALVTTAQRGVEVSLIIPDKNDSVMVEWASRSFFTELLNAGVHIYRFYDGLLHTKSVLIDEEYCLIGSVNLDMRSLWLNFEVSIASDDPDFCRSVYCLQKKYLESSVKIEKEEWEERLFINKPIEQFFYIFAPLL